VANNLPIRWFRYAFGYSTQAATRPAALNLMTLTWKLKRQPLNVMLPSVSSVLSGASVVQCVSCS